MSQNDVDVANERHDRRLSAILAADVAGYSRMMGADEDGTLQALKAHRRAVVDPAIASHRGRIVKTTGDGTLVEFASAVHAVRCAVDVQRGMAERNEGVPPERRIEFRIGINVGDIIGDGEDIFGDGVNVAARLQAMAEPGGIIVSRAVRDPVRDKLAFTFEDLGEVTAKNIARPIHVFRVRHDTDATRLKLTSPLLARRIIIAAVGVLAVLGAGMGAWLWRMQTFGNPPPPLSLVVLPFENLSADAADDYLVAGITDDLTTALSHVAGAFIISRATAYTYRGKTQDIRQIGRDLGVRYVVRGSVQRRATVLRVNAELGSTESGAQLWSDSFDQSISDMTAGQEQIVIRMRTALNVSLADIEAARSLRERPTNPDAFDLILQARAISLLPRTKDTLTKSLGLYEEALERDPKTVPALTGAAEALVGLYYFDAMPYDAAIGRAKQYLERAQRLDPNSESVLDARAVVLGFYMDGLDYRQALSELEGVARKLIDLYPNNSIGYFELGVVRRNQARYDEAAELFETTVRLNPRDMRIKAFYWNVASCRIISGNDREGLTWADRAITAEGSLPSHRVMLLLALRVAAYVRTGDLDTAKRIARELNDGFPFHTWRIHSPEDPDSGKNVAEYQSYQEAMKTAGVRDHAEPDADFGVAPTSDLHPINTKTPTTVPGVTTVNTEQLVSMLRDTKPLVIDTMLVTWYRSIPGAVGLDFNGNTSGSFTDEVQKRLEAKLHALTDGEMAKPIVAVGWNSEVSDGYNLALRVRHAGYRNVYWYRGGREAWEVAGKPEDRVRPTNW